MEEAAQIRSDSMRYTHYAAIDVAAVESAQKATALPFNHCEMLRWITGFAVTSLSRIGGRREGAPGEDRQAAGQLSGGNKVTDAPRRCTRTRGIFGIAAVAQRWWTRVALCAGGGCDTQVGWRLFREAESSSVPRASLL